MKKFAAALLLGLIAFTAPAQTAYPTKPVKVIVPFPVGQATDVIARILSQDFTETLGQSFYVDNKGGAAAIVGMEAAKAAPADG